eukprot:TRINITY_DN6978_c0_g1_i1.p1 TRINITY_DN6978_c0_g1~~TRINITY_DN6978_c0_g1_i1.p1  ORF type:complete len:301 (-),score=66.25 TRINITY_DN6978_c0_g1_i1:338-1138(-)
MGTPVTITLEELQDTIREKMKARGAFGIRGIARAFKNYDDNGNKMLDKYEFSKALTEMGLHVNKMEFSELMRHYDKNGDGNISFDEFLFALRPPLSDRRKKFVKLAFGLMDADGSGEITLSDIKQNYDAKGHPKVLAKEMTEDQALEELLYAFEGDGLGGNQPGNHDGVVTYDEWERYYSMVSASIDDDDYFELMMRNAWHISGGEGAMQNTSCLRVLVTHTDGRQTVEEVKNDLGLKKTDIEGIKKRLRAQGITTLKSISIAGGV